MEKTLQASKVLAAALKMHGWNQIDLASRTGLARTQISFHLTGERPIRDDHLAAYCRALDRDEQHALVAAWLRDVMTGDVVDNLLSSETHRIGEEVRRWRPSLDAEQRSMLDYWAGQICADSELDHIFRSLTRKAGWSPDEVTIQLTREEAALDQASREAARAARALLQTKKGDGKRAK